jgi:hypothetical protein
MKRLVLVAIAAFVWVAPASAKGLLGAELCGPGTCVSDRTAGLIETPGGPFGDQGEVAAPTKPGPWFKGNLLIGDGQSDKVYGRVRFYYVPERGLIVQPGMDGQATTWIQVRGAFAALLARLADGLKPYGAPKLTNVLVNGVPARDPQSYLRLFTIGSATDQYPTELRSSQIVLRSATPTPWSDGNTLVVYAKSHLLVRDGQFVSIPPDVADRATRGVSLDSGGGLPWTLLAAAVAAILVVVGTAVRFRPHAVPRPVPQS